MVQEVMIDLPGRSEVVTEDADEGDPVAAADHDERDHAQRAAERRERVDSRAALLDATVAGEAVDPAWAPGSEKKIVDAFAAEASPGAGLRAVTCKTTLCVAEIEHPEGSKRGVGGTRWGKVFRFPHTFVVYHPPGPDEPARSVAYLARDGYRLPK
ncbi:hypothetical protein [Enhygromyxa salina]|uniref:hypothetical protein n=1 Tax=Enhygromyxa salina TaxID=215803 RepID=UPI0011B28498|nr:hypothetical protein [Enhygromyxa salina]